MASEGPLVLCIDDERIGLRVRKLLLERAGYTVLTAPDGPSGLDLFADNPVEAVLLDYSMPGMNGGDVAMRMRRCKPRIPILLLSAYVGLPPETVALVDDFVTKADDAPTLLAKLNSLLPARSAAP
jgi:CheY-like chemotaxis protein